MARENPLEILRVMALGTTARQLVDPLALPLSSKEVSVLHMLTSKSSAGQKEHEQEILIFNISLIYPSQHQVTTLFPTITRCNNLDRLDQIQKEIIKKYTLKNQTFEKSEQHKS